MSVFDEVEISDPGGGRPKRVPGAAAIVSWEISGPGSFSGFVPLPDLRAAGLGGDLKQRWLRYASSAGPFAGVISSRPTTDGYAEIVAQGMAALLSGRVLTGAILALSGSPGGVARRAIQAAGVSGPNFIQLGSIDEGGGPLAMDLVGDVGSDILPQIAEAGDVEWIVTAEREFTLARRLGRDRSREVRLVEDRHFVSPRVNEDASSGQVGPAFRVQSEASVVLMRATTPSMTQPAVHPPTNPAPPILAPDPRTWPLLWQPVGVGYGSAAVSPYGDDVPRPPTQTYVVEGPGVLSQPSLNTSPPAWLASTVGVGANHPGVPSLRHAPPPTVPVELTLANVDDCFVTFDLGDTVRLDLDSDAATGYFRMMAKALDVASQTLTVTGEFLREM